MSEHPDKADKVAVTYNGQTRYLEGDDADRYMQQVHDLIMSRGDKFKWDFEWQVEA